MDVAAKVHRAMLHPEEYDLAQAVARRRVLQDLVAELRALIRIKHRHVIDFIAIACSSDVVVGKRLPIWIITAIADCGSVYDAIHHEEQILFGLHAQELTRQVASGLQYLHGRDIVHRDIKSKNLLVMSDGRVVIADLGLAKLCRRLSESAGDPGTRCGSPNYIGPEGAQSTSSARDMYALGCVLCEAVLRRDPDQCVRDEHIALANSFLQLQGFRLVKDVMNGLLESKPEDRPSAATVVDRLRDPNASVAWVALVIMQHQGSTRVVEDGCRQLTSVCHKFPLSVSSVEMLCGVVSDLVVKHEKHVSILLECFRLLVELLGGGEANARACGHRLDEHGTACRVITALRNHARDVALHEIGVTLLAEFCRALRGEEGRHKENIFNADGLSVILAALGTHLHEAVVQEQGYGFLAELCHGMQGGVTDLCRQSLAKENVLRGLVKTLQAHAQHVGVQKAGITCLVNLCRGEDCHVSERRRTVCRSDAVLVVVSAAGLHHDQSDIQEGCKNLISELASETDDVFLQMLQRRLSMTLGMLGSSPRSARIAPNACGQGATRRIGCHHLLTPKSWRRLEEQEEEQEQRPPCATELVAARPARPEDRRRGP